MSHYRMSKMAAFLLTLAIVAVTAVAQENEVAASPPNVSIPGTQLLHLRSAIVGQDYDLLINLPRNYRDSTKAFPVLYLLDAQWDFPLLNAIYGEQYYDGFVPDIIIVGISWGGQNPNYDYLRARDLTPTTSGNMPHSGNAPKFLGFVKNELIPFIESKYRTVRDDRALMGSSFGGLFTLYAMFHETGVFNRYVVASPALGWDNQILVRYEKDYAGKHTRLPVRLFMAMGGLEGGQGEFLQFANQLKERRYEGLDLQTRILDGIGHS
ncbi:MAG TPA: alpha/beta hydrolase-fold protein, partial [bacterium]